MRSSRDDIDRSGDTPPPDRGRTAERRDVGRWVALSFAVAISGCAAETRIGGLEAAIVSVDDASNAPKVHLMVANGTDATVFFYTQRERVSYSAADRELHLDLRVHVWVPTGSSADCHWFGGSFAEAGPGATYEWDVPLGITELRPGMPGFWRLDVRHDVDRITVDIGWSDVPLEVPSIPYECTHDHTTRLHALERGVLGAEWVRPAP